MVVEWSMTLVLIEAAISPLKTQVQSRLGTCVYMDKYVDRVCYFYQTLSISVTTQYDCIGVTGTPTRSFACMGNPIFKIKHAKRLLINFTCQIFSIDRKGRFSP